MPALAIINGFKGEIDFYYWMGIPVARSWPRSPGHERAPAVQAQWPAWTTASRLWAKLSPFIRAQYDWMAAGSRLTGRDMFTKGYISNLYLEGV